MYSQDQRSGAHAHDGDNQGPRFIWTVGFLALGTLSAIGAAALFPWYLAIAIAVLVVGLASACAFQFRVTNNPLYLVAMVLMTGLASFLDGVSVWELLNESQNSGLHVASATEGALESQLKSTQGQADSLRVQIAAVVQEAADMDNDGNSANDKLIPGRIALAESLKADLANVQSRVDELQAKSIAAATATTVTDKQRHILLQMADEHPQPARWLILWSSVVFLIPEFTLALLAWSMHGGGNRRSSEKQEANALAGLSAGGLFPAQLTPQHAQWLLQHQLHAIHSLSHGLPAPHGASLPSPVPVQAAAGLSPVVNSPLAVAGRTTSTTTTTQEATGFATQSALSTVSAPVPVQEPSEAASQTTLSPLAVVGGHPGLIDHAHPEGLLMTADAESSERHSHEAPSPAHASLSTLREAKKRKHNLFGSSVTKAHKQKGRKARNLSELAARLN